MDIQPAYSCLLGRPWIHAAGAIPSLLHYNVKFIVNGQLIIVMGEKEIMVSTSFPTIETGKGDIKPSKAVIMAAK
ncbi:hypothetical protein CR513_14260, partial [Mucuna pruriens]